MESDNENDDFSMEKRYDRITDRMNEIRESPFFCKIGLSGQDKKYVTSVFLLAAFTEHMIESALGEPDLMLKKMKEFSEKVTTKSIECLSSYMDDKKLEIDEINVREVLETSKLLNFTDVFINFSDAYKNALRPENVVNAVKIAEMYSNDKMYKEVLIYMLENFEIINRRNFAKLNLETVVKLLKSKDLNIQSEKLAFEAVKIWISYDETTRRKNMKRLLGLLKLPLLPTEYLLNEVVPYIKCDPDSKQLVENVIKWHVSPQNRHEMVFDINPRDSAQILLLVGEWSLSLAKRIDLYDPKSNTWSKFCDLNIDKSKFGVAHLDDRLVLIGGEIGDQSVSSVEMVHLKTKSISSLPNLNHPRYFPAVVVCGKYIYAIGGMDKGLPTNFVERWDPKTLLWSVVAPMKHSRVGLGAIVYNGKIFVIGGGMNDVNKTVEFYNPVQNIWKDGPSMMKKRKWVGVTVIDRHIYAIGGVDDAVKTTDDRYKSNEVLDLSTKKWTSIPDLLHNGDGIAVHSLGNKIFCAGGYNINSHSYFQQYDVKTNSWTELAPILNPRVHSRLLGVSRDFITN